MLDASTLELQWSDIFLLEETPTPAQYAEQCVDCPNFDHGCTVEDCPYDPN